MSRDIAYIIIWDKGIERNTLRINKHLLTLNKQKRAKNKPYKCMIYWEKNLNKTEIMQK